MQRIMNAQNIALATLWLDRNVEKARQVKTFSAIARVASDDLGFTVTRSVIVRLVKDLGLDLNPPTSTLEERVETLEVKVHRLESQFEKEE